MHLVVRGTMGSFLFLITLYIVFSIVSLDIVNEKYIP